MSHLLVIDSMQEQITQKRSELISVLYAIQQKMDSLEKRGLSMAIFDQRTINDELNRMETACKTESAKLSVTLDDNNQQTAKDQNLKTGFEKFMKDEGKKLAGLKENANHYTTFAKKCISDLNVRKLKSFSSKGNCVELFRYLFSLLYNKQESEYDGNLFASLALGSDADDFQIKLASFNTSKFHADTTGAEVEKFKRIKDKPIPEANNSPDLRNLLCWMDYIVELYLTEVEIKDQQKNIKNTQDEWGQRLSKIASVEEDNKRKRQALQILKNTEQQLKKSKRAVEEKARLISTAAAAPQHNGGLQAASFGTVNGPFRTAEEKEQFKQRLQTFNRELFDLPTHF